MTDRQLLARYATSGSEDAFAQLVKRHADWVYSAAVRLVRDRNLADDVAQAVFIVLAQKAHRIAIGASIGGWLLKVTRYAAAHALQAERRRVRHERRAAAMTREVGPAAESRWEEIAPVLDELVTRLSFEAREAVMLRFYQRKSMAEVGAELGVSEDAAKKRVAKAVDRLRSLFLHKGITLPAAALGAALIAHTTQGAPVALVAAAAPSTAALSAESALLVKGTIAMMFWTKAKFVAAIMAAVVLVGGAGTVGVLQLVGAAEPAQVATRDADAASGSRLEDSAFPEIRGCRLRHVLIVRLNNDADHPPIDSASVYEQTYLSIAPNKTSDLDKAATQLSIAVHKSSGDMYKDLPDRSREVWQGVAFNTRADFPYCAIDYGSAVLGSGKKEQPASALEPGEYWVWMRLNSEKKMFGHGLVKLTVKPLPYTQIQVADIRPDGTINFQTILQSINTSDQPLREEQFNTYDFMTMKKMVDADDKLLQFTSTHDAERKINRHQVTLNTPVAPGQPNMKRISGTMNGMIRKQGDEFTYDLEHAPGRIEARRVELYQLPKGATLVSTTPADLPHREVDGQIQICADRLIPPNGAIANGFRYKLSGAK